METSFRNYPDEKLKGVIFVSRHSIRRQFPSSLVSMDLWAPGREFAKDDSDWGVDKVMGTLTQHGHEAAKLMGLHECKFYQSKLGSRAGCNGTSVVYCEEFMPRDEYSAKGFFEGFLPDRSEIDGSCEIPRIITHKVEYILNQGNEPLNSDCRIATSLETAGRLGNIKSFASQYKPLLEKLGTLLGCCDPSLCEGNLDYQGQCNILNVPYKWDSEHWFVTYTGPLYAGKYFSEWFMLTMLNNQDFGFGKLSEEDVMEFSKFVTAYRSIEFDAMAARPFGSMTLLHLMGTIEQIASGHSIDGVDHDPSANIIFYAAHDTNILFLAELLDLKWVVEGWQPNHTPPMGILVFEVYENLDKDGEPLIGAYFHAQRPGDMRSLNAGIPPDRVAVTIPGCTGAGSNGLLCQISDLKSLVARVTDLRCVDVKDDNSALRAYGRDLWDIEVEHHHVGVGGVKAVPSPHRLDIYSGRLHLWGLLCLGTIFALLFRIMLPRFTPYIRKHLGKRKHLHKKEEEMYNGGRLLSGVVDA